MTDGIYEAGQETGEDLEVNGTESAGNGGFDRPAESGGDYLDRDVSAMLDAFLGEPRREEARAPEAGAEGDGAEAPEPEDANAAYIPQDMSIKGHVTLASNIRVCGVVEGNVNCEQGVILTGGRIVGNVRCGSLTVASGSIKGDARVKGDATMERDTFIEGNVSAVNLYSDATHKGDIVVTDTLKLKSCALAQGNITAQSISVDAGAKIEGMMKIAVPEKRDEAPSFMIKRVRRAEAPAEAAGSPEEAAETAEEEKDPPAEPEDAAAGPAAVPVKQRRSPGRKRSSPDSKVQAEAAAFTPPA